MEGSVRFVTKECEQILKPGEEIVYEANSKKFETHITDTQYNTAWVSGRYNYNDVTFAVLANKLEKYTN